MSNINVKLNLLNLACVVRTEKGKLGPVDCLVIPIEKNNLFRGDKGIYLDLIAFELKEKKVGEKGDIKTHLVKQSIPKAVFDKMTDEQKKATPILGDFVVFERQDPDTISSPVPIDEIDPLPF